MGPLLWAFVTGARTEVTVTTARLGEKASTAQEMAQRLGVEIPDGAVFDELPQWMQDAAAEAIYDTFEQPYWQQVAQTTRDDVQTTLQRGIREGLSVPKVAQAVMDNRGPGYAKWRGLNTARTESGNMLNAGHRAGMQQLEEDLGIRIDVEWLSILGTTTRPEHAEMDGVTVRQGEMFNLDGWDVPWPGHYSLPARHRCNCQCTVLSAPAIGPMEGDPYDPSGEDSRAKYQRPDGTWTEGRQQLHNQIIRGALAEASPVKEPTAYMMGGGPASGKSVALKSGNVSVPENMVLIDTDEIKKAIPEYQVGMKNRDTKAAAFCHRESSYISQRVLDEAAKSGYNTMLDGTGDGGMEKLSGRIARMKQKGQKVVAHYVTVDTEVAVARNEARYKATGRMVPEEFVRNTHAQISEVVPQAIDKGLYDEFALWDTNTEGEVILVAEASGTNLVIHDDEAWQAFLAKANPEALEE